MRRDGPLGHPYGLVGRSGPVWERYLQLASRIRSGWGLEVGLRGEGLGLSENSPERLQAERERAGNVGGRVTVVASAVAGEGRTITGINLACALSVMKDSRVLLLDGDLRTPGVHALLGLEREPGLGQLLEGKVGLEEAIRELGDNLHVLPAGTVGSPVEQLLGEAKLEELLRHLRGQYGYVVVDVPSLSAVSDGGIWVERADGVLMVVKAGGTSLGVLRSALELVPSRRLVGCVVNQVERGARGVRKARWWRRKKSDNGLSGEDLVEGVHRKGEHADREGKET